MKISNSEQTLNDIKNSLSLLANIGLADITNSTLARQDGRRTHITWSTGFDSANSLREKSFASIDEYRYYLRNNMANAVLFDGSLLQVSYVYEGKKLLYHRLCFYPCPFDLDCELLQELPYDDVVEMYAADVAETRLKTPIRFDYHHKRGPHNHPRTHAHFNIQDCRCPVVAPIGMWNFIYFIVFSFYSAFWEQVYRETNVKLRALCTSTITREEQELLHFSFQN